MMNLPTVYQIRVSGHLDSEWGEWFGGFTIDNQLNGESTLTGEVVDQAILHGLLQQLFALNLTLIAVNRLDGRAAGEHQQRSSV
jgi:hypothetical protein